MIKNIVLFEDDDVIITSDEGNNETENNETSENTLQTEETDILLNEDNEIISENESTVIDYSEILNNIYTLLKEFESIVYLIAVFVLLDFVFKHIKSYFH